MTEAAGITVDGVTVTPERFSLVDYDAAEIAQVAAEMARRLGLQDRGSMRVEVDETTPLGRSQVASIDPIVLAVESGAFEDTHRPRQFHANRARDVLGRVLFRVRDRLDPAFGDPPADDDLTLPVSTAWDVYAVARLARLGYPDQKARRLYQFRVRHGFSDEVDNAFARLWTAEDLTWADIQDISDGAAKGG